MNNGQTYASIIRESFDRDTVIGIIKAVEGVTFRKKRSDIIIACTNMLAEVIVSADPCIKAEVREGIIALIDGFVVAQACDEDTTPAKRAANTAHRQRINLEILAVLTDPDGLDLPEGRAKALITDVARGEVPNMSIGY